LPLAAAGSKLDRAGHVASNAGITLAELGVRRTRVTLVSGKLHQLGLILQGRGKIEILGYRKTEKDRL
jgi:hypothetical protein